MSGRRILRATKGDIVTYGSAVIMALVVLVPSFWYVFQWNVPLLTKEVVLGGEGLTLWILWAITRWALSRKAAQRSRQSEVAPQASEFPISQPSTKTDAACETNGHNEGETGSNDVAASAVMAGPPKCFYPEVEGTEAGHDGQCEQDDKQCASQSEL